MRFETSFAVVFLLGCSSTPAAPDGGADASTDADGGAPSGSYYASGTRLRAEVYASTDGAKVWHGWYDSKLGVECVYGHGEDGVTRCLPQDAFWDVTTFADDKCTQPIVGKDACYADPKFAVVPPTTGCNAQVFAVGAKLGTLPTTYSNQSGSCIAATNGSPTVWYSPGAKQDPTAFVQGTLSREARGTEVAMQVTVGEDGSREPGRLYDTARKATCATLEFLGTPNADRCVPYHVGYFEAEYSDLGCSVPAADLLDQSCTYGADDVVSAVWFYDQTGTCAGSGLTGIRALGATSTGPLYRNPSACALDPYASPMWGAIGADIPATSFPAIARTDIGQGRVVERWQTSQANNLFVESFYDSQSKMACDPNHDSADVLRCMPRVTAASAYYSDDTCKTLVVLSSSSTTCPVPPPTMVYVQSPATCTTHIALYAVGAKIAPPAQVYFQNDTSCDPTTVDMTSDFYGVTAVDPATVPALTDVRE